MPRRKRILAAVLLASLLLSACGAPAAPAGDDSGPARKARKVSLDTGPLVLSEVMPDNRATLFDADGAASDWIELCNPTDTPVSLAGWKLTDRSAESAWRLPGTRLGAGERLLIFASGKNREQGELHTDFSLSEGETLLLLDPQDQTADSLTLPALEPDRSLVRDDGGGFASCSWPTPGQENSAEGYLACQDAQTAEGPLLISEVMTANLLGSYDRRVTPGSDWVELLNISDAPVELSDFFLSDDADDYFAHRLPAGTLEPGQYKLLTCREDGTGDLPFSLSDDQAQLFLCTEDRLLDAMALHDLPLDGSCGRLDGEAGLFYFAKGTPGAENPIGYRRISAQPVDVTPGGCYDGVDALDVTLSAAPGAEIRYTLDGSVPDTDSALYTGPVRLEETGVLRAVAYERDALPSRVLTQTYFLNEDFSLPVVSLVLDDPRQFKRTYDNKIKHFEMPGSIAFYEEGGSFSLPCGVTLSGATSLDLPKKNLSVRFRGAYGSEWLDYDLFDGGVDRFASLTLRAGQDYYFSVIRNELCQDLALEFSDHLLVQRSRFCVLYVNGSYFGLYALKEKVTRQLYASTFSVSKDSVTMEEASVRPRDAFFREVYAFVIGRDMSNDSNYAQLCQRLDIDSLVDWAVLEGYFANNDLLSGNLRYVRSLEDDGKWRLVFFDLDAALHRRELSFTNVLGPERTQQQITQILRSLLNNPSFREKLIARTAEALRGTLAPEHVRETAEAMLEEIEQERLRDFKHWKTSETRFQFETKHMLSFLDGYDSYAVNAFCRLLHLSDEERSQWFPEWAS